MDSIEKYFDISLNEKEKEDLYKDYISLTKDIEKEFEEKTKLDNLDIKFLLFAITLQVVRQYFLTGNLGESFDVNTRLNHDNKKMKEEVESQVKKYTSERNNKWENKKSEKKYRSWQEIVTTLKVPYDANVGAPNHNLKLEGKYHRFHTLGHDPLLGWIFGTLNILTDTMTLRDLSTYKINMAKGLIIEEKSNLINTFYSGYESLIEDWHRLPAAIFAQGIHLKSDCLVYNRIPRSCSIKFQ